MHGINFTGCIPGGYFKPGASLTTPQQTFPMSQIKYV